MSIADLYWEARDLDERFHPSHFAVQPFWLLTQALRANKRKINMRSLATAHNTYLLLQVNKDPKKEDKDTAATLSSFLPYPDVYDNDNAQIELNILPKTARALLNSYKDLPSYVKYAISDYIKDLRVLAKR